MFYNVLSDFEFGMLGTCRKLYTREKHSKKQTNTVIERPVYLIQTLAKYVSQANV